MIPIIRFARVHDPDTADARQLALTLGATLPAIIQPVPVATRSRAGDNRQRRADIGPGIGLVFVGDHQLCGAVIGPASIDVEPADALLTNPPCSLLDRHQQRARFLGVKPTAPADDGSAFVLSEWHVSDALVKRGVERAEHHSPFLVGRGMATDGISAFTPLGMGHGCKSTIHHDFSQTR